MGKNQCNECAFKPGAVANKELYNQLRSEVCALAGRPFFCHHAVDWQNERAWADQRKECRVAGTCAGWRERIRELARKGWFKDPDKRATRRWVGEYILEQIEQFVSTSGEDKSRASKAIKSSLRILFAGRFKLRRKRVRATPR